MSAENIPNLGSVIDEAKRLFLHEYGTDSDAADGSNQNANIVVYAPGRVNLIGEHTDYNDGFVLPMALPMVTVIVGRQITDTTNISTIITTNADADKPRRVQIEMPDEQRSLVALGPPKWSAYIKGVISYYLGARPIQAFQALIHSSIPTGAGLSSSAAIETAMYLFLDAITGCSNQISDVDKAKACQKAEHDYAKMPCGIMDQFISLMGRKNQALLIDCRSLDATLIPISDPNIVILVINSNVKHELSTSEYATRRQQCQRAAILLNKSSLRDATLDDINYLKSLKTCDELIVKRARHVVTEIQRTIDAGAALKRRDFIRCGQLMCDSHQSLKHDYEVSCTEIDQLVDLTMMVDGVLGSRMTGGGFGGCTVTMVYSHAVDNVISHVEANYVPALEPTLPTFYICQPSDGAAIVESA